MQIVIISMKEITFLLYTLKWINMIYADYIVQHVDLCTVDLCYIENVCIIKKIVKKVDIMRMKICEDQNKYLLQSVIIYKQLSKFSKSLIYPRHCQWLEARTEQFGFFERQDDSEKY